MTRILNEFKFNSQPISAIYSIGPNWIVILIFSQHSFLNQKETIGILIEKNQLYYILLFETYYLCQVINACDVQYYINYILIDLKKK